MTTSIALHTLECSVRRYSGEHASHVHDAHAQLLYALDGRMELEVDGRSCCVDTASGVWIPPGARHAYLAPPGAHILVMDVAMPQHSSLQRLRRFSVPAAARCLPHLLDNANRLQLLLQAPVVLAQRPVDVHAISQHITPLLHQPWPTARMAALCHLSPARFHARWLALTGHTPQQWLRQLRLHTAEHWLAAGRSLAATASACGYSSASALGYALRRDRGSSARTLRQRL